MPASPAIDLVDGGRMLPMRDGVRLATDIYLPRTARPLPVLVERTPYDRRGISRSETLPGRAQPLTRPEIARHFADHGYAVVIQDCRGRYGSEGKFVKYVHEAEDGYDTLQWIANQPWCNGRIGMMGLSYGAHTQLAAACLSPPGLACLFMDSGGFASAYHGGIRRGGAFELKQATWAHRHALRHAELRGDEALKAALCERDLRDWFRDMPWRPGHSPLSPAPEFEEYLFEQWRSAVSDSAWRRAGLYAEAFYDDLPKVPVAIVCSWYDPYAWACVTHFQRLTNAGNRRVRLLMGPWTHGDRSATHAGEVDFGPAARLEGNLAEDYLQYRLDWFQRFLKDPRESLNEPPVRYFRMGGGTGARNGDGRLQHGGEWRSSGTWPPAGRSRRFYLTAAGDLTPAAPTTDHEYTEYRFDPDDPVPTIGGAITSGDPVMLGGAFDQRIGEATFTYRRDPAVRALADRPDVLVFETPELEHDLDITGPVTATLWVSSDRPDTDFTIKLLDVYPPSENDPEGFAMNITDGILRARYREGFDRELLMAPGAIYCIEIAAFPTSNLFRKGHRLRLDISSSNYPQFDINPNSGAPEGSGGVSFVATNRIYCDAARPSWIELHEAEPRP